MGNINSVHISGRLVRDPELRTTASGTNILAMGVVVNDRRKNAQTGQWEDYPNFIDCTMFGARTESLSKILHKGQLVCIAGKLHYSSWERDGQKRSKIEVLVDEIEIPQSEAYRQQGQQQAPQQPQYQQPAMFDPAFQNQVTQMFQQPLPQQYADVDILF